VKITILNGNPKIDNIRFDNYIDALTDMLKSYRHSVTAFKLREMDIKHCIGCWSCWVETPGECIIPDEAGGICREYINSDFVIFASPVIMGFTSALLKKAMERLLPLVHPYFEVVKGEIHHLSRYDKYPLIGLLIQKGRDTDEEDIKIISDIYMRSAVNIKTSLRFTKLTDDSVEEVVSAINNI
jgi:multimeric flavodoxin WrbA